MGISVLVNLAFTVKYEVFPLTAVYHKFRLISLPNNYAKLKVNLIFAENSAYLFYPYLNICCL